MDVEWGGVERRDSLDLGFRVWPVGLQQKGHGRCREVSGTSIWAPQWGHLASRERRRDQCQGCTVQHWLRA